MRRLVLIAAVAAGCGGERQDPGAVDLFAAFEAARDAEPIAATTRLGPAVAEVKLSPAAPRLGDVLYLELSVSAPEGVDVVMPAFGEALGRFSLDDFDHRQSRDPETGEVRHAQLYQLQAQMSGHVRIPSLRIEVTDQRPGAKAPETRELLTDELAFTIAPIHEGSEPPELVAGPGRIDVPAPPLRERWWIWALAIVALLAISVLIVLWNRRRSAGIRRATAYERAIEQLELLESAGLPEADEIDAWYVELSSIVRHYLEGRFAVRAPELTTEEFLREAGAALSPDHQRLLGEFLAGCDRVKFARHMPTEAEMGEALSTALAFVRQTRPETTEEAA